MSMSKEELIIGFFEKGYCCDLDEVKNTCLDLLRENQKYKEVIDKAIEYIEKRKIKDEFLELNEWGTRDLLDILKEVE